MISGNRQLWRGRCSRWGLRISEEQLEDALFYKQLFVQKSHWWKSSWKQMELSGHRGKITALYYYNYRVATGSGIYFLIYNLNLQNFSAPTKGALLDQLIHQHLVHSREVRYSQVIWSIAIWGQNSSEIMPMLILYRGASKPLNRLFEGALCKFFKEWMIGICGIILTMIILTISSFDYINNIVFFRSSASQQIQMSNDSTLLDVVTFPWVFRIRPRSSSPWAFA